MGRDRRPRWVIMEPDTQGHALLNVIKARKQHDGVIPLRPG